jgi:hypothetical protein
MTPENFCHWLQGVFDAGESICLTNDQLQKIKDNLRLVLKTEETLMTEPTSPYWITRPSPYYITRPQYGVDKITCELTTSHSEYEDL